MATGANVGTLLLSLPLMLIYLPTESESIMCYQCNSAVDMDCVSLLGNETDSSPFYRECDEHAEGTNVFCRKIVQQIKDVQQTVRVIRRCGWEKNLNQQPCYWFEDDDHKEVVCQCMEDGCNGTPGRRADAPSVLLQLVVLACAWRLWGSGH